MTKEEAIRFLKRDHCWKNVPPDTQMAIETLMQEPSLPANVDEAAEKIASDIVPKYPDINWDICFEKIVEGVKAGAKWIAGQGETIEGTLGYGPHLQRPIIMLEGVPKFYDGHSQEVIVQIRKA